MRHPGATPALAALTQLAVRRRIEELGLGDHVRILGFVDEQSCAPGWRGLMWWCCLP